jgi:hypothetical protein
MTELLSSVPDAERRNTLKELESRQEKRAATLVSNEETARKRAASTEGGAAALAKEISDLRIDSISQQFEDRVRTLVPLVRKYERHRLEELRDALLSDKIIDPLIFPQAIEKFSSSRLQTFDKYLREPEVEPAK